MDRARYLELLAADGALLRRAAAQDLDAVVPTCPGWTVRDAVEHTAEVYEHKLACIDLAGEKPEPWPPAWPDRDPLDWFDDAHRRLLDVLGTTDPAAPSWTWWPEDQTAGFWVRRMAQETAVHRADVESAFGAVSPVDPQLALDGIDEVLVLMLAGDWSIDVQPALTGTVAASADGAVWRIVMSPAEVVVDASATTDGTDAVVSGDPSGVLLWMYGRAGDDAVQFTGDPAAAHRLRQRLALATQ